jgi:hypothetical protein
MWSARQRRGTKGLQLGGAVHIGQVVNNNPMQTTDTNSDPNTGSTNNKNSGVTVRIAGLHDQVPNSDLPMYDAIVSGHANSSTAGSIGPIPPIGATVIVSHDHDSPYHGTYHGSPGTQDQQPKELVSSDTTGNNYPFVTAYVDPYGNRHTSDGKRNLHTFEHASGTQTSIDGMGNIAVKQANKAVGAGATAVQSNGITIELQGMHSMNAKGPMVIGAQKIQIVATGDLMIGAKGNIMLAAGGQIFMKKPIMSNPGVPTVTPPTAPTARSVPNIAAPADPTAGTTSTG